MDIKFVYNRLPKNFNVTINIDWKDDSNSLYQGWVPAIRKDFSTISKIIEEKIRAFFIDNKIMPQVGLDFSFTAFHTFWQFEVASVWIESDYKNSNNMDINFHNIDLQIVCHCADIEENVLSEIISEEDLDEEDQIFNSKQQKGK